MSARPEADPQLGRTLGGQYRIEALLGAGGMGRVYRGRQLSVNRPVAIKVIAGQAPYPPEWVRRFRREAEATASLSHPNSVRLFDFGVTEAEELFMVMELLEGSDLARQLQARGPLPLVEALAIVRQVLLALCEAHAFGITHRDIKPDNIFLANVRGADVIAKVMDFGIAGIAQAQRSSRLTGAGMIIGTPMYMSPEQAQGLRVDGKSDVYSLGVVLFEMLTGRPVFESHTAVTLLLAHVARAPMRLDEAGVQLREQSSLQALLDRLLAKDPSERPSAAEALDTVTALSTRLGVAGATGSMRAVDVQSAAPVPGAVARRGKQPSAAGRALAEKPVSLRPPRSATPSPEAGADEPSGEQRAYTADLIRARRSATLTAAGSGELDPALRGVNAERIPTTPDAAPSSAAARASIADSARASLKPSPSAGAKERGRRARGTGELAAPLSAADVALAFEGDDVAGQQQQFRSARAASAPTGAWLQPGFVLLGTGLVLGAASALALRWGPMLMEAARPTPSVATEVATPAPPPEQRTVLINSQPSGANVLVEGEKVGTTPFQLKVQGDTEVSVARDGYVRQLVRVPYDARAPVLVKLESQPPASGEDKEFFLSLRQESQPRIAPRADTDHERRDQPALAREPRAGRAPSAATDHERGAQAPSAALADNEDERSEHDARLTSATLPAREPIERVEPEPGVYRHSDATGSQRQEDSQSAGLDVARVLEMGREADDQRAAKRARDRAAELANEHGATREALPDEGPRRRDDPPPIAAETSRSAATHIAAIREDEVAEIALDDDERAHVAQHYGLRAIGRAVARAFGRLLIPYPNRERRAALARMPLMYPSFREARAAYKSRELDATGFQEAVWQLRERRRRKIWDERDRYARGELSQGQYQAKVDRIWDEFWGPR